MNFWLQETERRLGQCDGRQGNQHLLPVYGVFLDPGCCKGRCGQDGHPRAACSYTYLAKGLLGPLFTWE